MADEDGSSSRKRRPTRGSDATARSQALERLKARRSGDRGSDTAGPQIRLENPIYDTIPEEEYNALVASRRDQARSFIVDDEGIGYGDEGEEEDWSKAGFSLSDDESEGESEKPKRKKDNSQTKRPSSSAAKLSAAAAMMGGQRVSSMFTSAVFKKSRDDKACESLVDEVLKEFAPDETDKLSRRKVQSNSSSISDKLNDAVQIKHSAESVIANVDVESVKVNKDNGSRLGLEQKCEIEVNESLGNDEGRMVVESNDCPSPSNGNLVEEKVVKAKEDEMEAKPVIKKEGFTLNAKVNQEVVDPKSYATAGWKAARSGAGGGGETNIADSNSNNQQNSEFNLEPEGSLPFYILDAYEEYYGANMGTLYLFGKVKTGNLYQSCCVVVKNMQRCVYAIPSHPLHSIDEMIKLEKDVEESRVSPADFRKKLQDAVSDIKNEIAKHLVDLGVSTFSMAPVKRNYAFERSDIPAGENYVVKINYPFKDTALPVDLKGESFCALLGARSRKADELTVSPPTCRALELFLIKRKIKGPSWLQVSNFSPCSASQRVSWCKFEVTVDTPKDIRVSSSSSSKITLVIPPVVVTTINLKTTINEKQNINEIVSASVVSCNMVKINTPMLASEWKRPGMLTHFTVIRKLDGNIFPMGFNTEVTDRNVKAGSNVLCVESSERALLNRLMLQLHKMDSDVLVGHNISGFDLDVLLHRSQACRVPSSMWSKLGRLNRSTMPKLDSRGKTFGFGADPAIMSCVAGRLLCNTYLCSRDLLKEVSYSLTHLAKTQLNQSRKEVAPHDVPKMFQTAKSLMELIEYGETDAWLSMELMFYLSVLPLTRQLTNISGNLWGKTLQGARAQRVEYLLLHEFHKKKYIVPDKFSNNAKETKLRKRRVTHGVNGGNFDDADINDANYHNDASESDHKKNKKAASYAGGLEYNICFTTVERSTDGYFPRLPSSKTTGVLPELLKKLVKWRRDVKTWMKTASGLKRQQLDIQQQALKLTANSMYGCLGFSNSRFYAKPLAELITLQGREILQSTVDLVQNNLNLEVIYGDTDSIMVYSGLDDIAKATSISKKVIQEVNKKYRCNIQGTSPERLADCLGLDTSKFQLKSSEALSDDPTSSLLFAGDDEERYWGCESLVLSCPSCSGTFDCPPVFKSICMLGNEKPTSLGAEESDYNFCRKLCCPKCFENGVGRISPAMIANQVKRQAEKFVLMYYRGLLMCDDETCKHTTQSVSFRLVGDSERGTVCPNYPRCNGHLNRKYTEADLYKQLSYFCHVFDTVCGIEKMEAKSRIPIEKELIKIRPIVDLAASTIQKIRDKWWKKFVFFGSLALGFFLFLSFLGFGFCFYFFVLGRFWFCFREGFDFLGHVDECELLCLILSCLKIWSLNVIFLGLGWE
ncbi:unnamed protein product [Trifolium pratense]|uniref:Uncharacterized protein n=1 Tax=Trifolium pratense TaxID=57577 RepID=A0ACB0KQ32_TRIPR|nr:unnamed protein product [Trifolium pratense]